jgi:hypothetical protein
MKSFWKLWVNAKYEKGAKILLKRVLDKMKCDVTDVDISPYHKGGHVISFSIEHDHQGWNDLVIEVISPGQLVAYGWGMYGDIHRDPSSSSNRTNISGVDMIEWKLFREDLIK